MSHELAWARGAGIDIVHWPVQNERLDHPSDALQAMLG